MIGGRSAADRSRHRQIEILPTMLQRLAREMRAGRTLHQSVRIVASDPAMAGPELGAALRRIDGGASVVASIDRWATELAHPDADLVRALLNTGVTTGGAMAASLDRAAESLRERVELQREIRALSSQARASALVLTVAPPAFLALIASVDPAILGVVMGTAVGRSALVAGVVLDVAGWVWMRRLVAGVVR